MRFTQSVREGYKSRSLADQSGYSHHQPLRASGLLIKGGISFQLVRFLKKHCVFIHQKQAGSLPHVEFRLNQQLASGLLG